MNEIKEDAKRRSEENVRMLNEFSERMRDAAEMEDEDERARAIEEVMNDQAEWMNGLNVSE
ncbi:MAG: hypothetical protein MJ142_01260 [Clostridia bacterium]|nr:hypothetical protein [Clostridia bacterium]